MDASATSVNEPIDREIPKEDVQIDDTAEEARREKLRREREARAQALTLEIVGDLPYAEVKPPENVLFVCKLNPVTEGLQANFKPRGSLLINSKQMMILTPSSVGLGLSSPAK